MSDYEKIAALRPDVRLQPHQKDMLRFVAGKPGAIANHGLGIGKTLQALAIAERLGGPCLVLTPASIRPQFKAQMEKFVTDDRHGAYTFLSYEGFAKDPGVVGRLRPQVVIVDEFHNFRNNVRERQALEEARARHKFFLLGLTGTLFSLSPEDVVPLVNLVAGKTVLSQAEFRRRYLREVQVPVTPEQRARGLAPGVRLVPQNLDHFGKVVSPWVHRVEATEETLSRMPEVRLEVVHVPMTPRQQALYAEMSRANRGLTARIRANLPASRSEARNMLMFAAGLRQVLGAPEALDMGLTVKDNAKLLRAAQDVGHAVGTHGDGARTVAFSGFLDAGVRRLSAALNEIGHRAEVFHGGLSDKERVRVVDSYNNGEIRLLGLSPAGGEGLNLKQTQMVQLLDPHWNPTRNAQAVGRAARLDSHDKLPPEKRVVVVRQYLTTYPEPTGVLGRLRARPSTADEWIYARAQERAALNRRFADAIPAAAGSKPAPMHGIPAGRAA